VALFADEAFYAGDRQHEGVLKSLITEPTLPIEGKYQNVIEVLNMLHIMMASNSDWVVPASQDERRYFVLNVPDTMIGRRQYFAAIAEQMENGGLAAMIYDMLQRDITQFEVRDIPSSEALSGQKLHSLDSLHKWWLACLDRGFVWKSRHGAKVFTEWQGFYTTELLDRSYLQWCRERRPYDRKDRASLGKMMTEIYQAKRPGGRHAMYELDSVDVDKFEKHGDWLDRHSVVWQENPRGYQMGNLDEARARFGEICETTGEWRPEL